MRGVAHGVELQAESRCMDMCSVHHVPASSMTVVRESMGASFKVTSEQPISLIGLRKKL